MSTELDNEQVQQIIADLEQIVTQAKQSAPRDKAPHLHAWIDGIEFAISAFRKPEEQ